VSTTFRLKKLMRRVNRLKGTAHKCDDSEHALESALRLADMDQPLPEDARESMAESIVATVIALREARVAIAKDSRP
jgi:hypothetical protein